MADRPPCNIKIINETICILKRTKLQSDQMLCWNEDFPEEIPPNSEIVIPVLFDIENVENPQRDYGEVEYEVFDNADLLLAKFNIAASLVEQADNSYREHVEVHWDTLPKVLGVMLSPMDGKLRLGSEVAMEILITGSVLEGGPRCADAHIKLTDWKSWAELQPLCTPGDVIAVNRGHFRHYGVVQNIESTGTVIISHLSGTADDVLSKHGIEALGEVKKALTGSHGDIAVIQTMSLEKFAGKDECRVENLHDETWRAYIEDVVLNRIAQATGHRDYSLLEFNCEHYANLIRYGMPYSQQIEEMRFKMEELKEKGEMFFEEQKARIQDARATVESKVEQAKEAVERKYNDLKSKIQSW